jgi:hypothetical protein
LRCSPLLSWPTLPTPASFRPDLYRRLRGGIVHPRGVNISLCTSLAITIWWSYGLTCALPAPPQMANAANISPFDRGLNRRVCGNKALSSAINLSLWTCFEVKNWWCYGLIYLYTLPPARLKTISLPLVKVHCVVRSSSAFILASTWIDHHWASQQSQLCGPFIEHVPLS